jgi:hypothetical protein
MTHVVFPFQVYKYDSPLDTPAVSYRTMQLHREAETIDIQSGHPAR